MKKILVNISMCFAISAGFLSLTNCKKTENPIIYQKGTFPDTVVNLSDINSTYDDYNVGLFQLYGNIPMVFSSNRGSSGGQFDLVQGVLSFLFDQTNGAFGLADEISSNTFITKLITKVNTPGNDFGPYRLYSSFDGYEYLLLSSVNSNGNLDFYYTKNRPVFGSVIPEVEGPFPAKLLNTNADEAYICFDTNQDSAYFSSNAEGNFDIFVHKRPFESSIDTWLNLNYESSAKVDSLNSSSDDKCPLIYKKIMVFASNRPGGMGGYDLYYSVFRKGKWSSPVNMGPRINTASDEFRPVIGGYSDFINLFMIFSSNKPGGNGGFDLYFTGIDFPE